MFLHSIHHYTRHELKNNQRLVLTIFILSFPIMFVECTLAALDGSLISCDNEGEDIILPLTNNNPCISCFCKDRVIKCRASPCPAVTGCHNIMFTPPPTASPCCKEVCEAVEYSKTHDLSGCRFNGTVINSGDRVADMYRPCTTLYCQGTVLTRSQDMCYTPCKNPVVKPGQCCPQCEGCEYRRETYAEGLKFADRKDPCVMCQCRQGNITCVKRACPELNCPNGSLVQPRKGECCTTCTGKRKVFSLKSKCLYHPHNKVYMDGEIIVKNECTFCTCQAGTVVCDKRTCPRLKCTKEEVLPAEPGYCCPRCAPPKKKCRYLHRKYKHGRGWYKDRCNKCKCDDGTIHCSRPNCSEIIKNCPLNTHQLQYRGYCCPVCVEVSATCIVFGDPYYQTFDGLLYTFQGTCQYILAQQCSSNNRDFSVRVHNSRNADSPHLIYTERIDIRLHNEKLKISLAQKLAVTVNSKPISLPYIKLGVASLTQRGYSIIMMTSIGLIVHWDGVSYLQITIPQRYKNRMCGLCGNYNGNDTDEFTGRGKVTYRNHKEFGSSWLSSKLDQCDPT